MPFLNLKIQNNRLLASHHLLTRYVEKAYLTTDVASGSSTLTIDNINGFAINKVLLLGNFGEPTAEIIKTHASTAPTGTTVTLLSNTVNDHFLGTPVWLIDYDQVEFNRATTLAGSKTILATQTLNADRMESVYADLTNTTGYGFYRFKNSITTTYSSYSDGVNYTGNSVNSVENIVTSALSLTGNTLNDDFAKEDDLINDAWEAQKAIINAKDWVFELEKDTSITLVQGENEYSTASLTYLLKYPGNKQGIFSLKVGNRLLEYVDYRIMDDIHEDFISDYLSADATVGATSITLLNSHSFAESGTVYLRENENVTYTANTEATGVLSGISASAITTLVSSGATVWQDVSVGTPNRYTFDDDIIRLDFPPDSTSAGQPLKLTYLKALPQLTSFASNTLVPFYHIMQYFVAHRIELRKKAFDEAQKYLDLFTSHISLNAARYKLQVGETQKYYLLSNTAKNVSDDNTD